MATELGQCLIDVYEHPDAHSPNERRKLRSLIEDRLDQPLTTDEAARVLGVTRHTIHHWLRAGLLPESASSTRAKRLLDTAGVYEARRVLSEAKLEGTPADRVDQLRGLAEELFLATHPNEAEALEEAIGQAERGELEPVEDDLIDAARNRQRELSVRPAV